MTVLEAAAALRARQVSSVELTRAALDQVDKLNPKLNAFITVLHDHAMRAAEGADRTLASGNDVGLGQFVVANRKRAKLERHKEHVGTWPCLREPRCNR